MSSAKSYPRVAIEIRPSRLLFLYSLLLAGAGVTAPWLCNIPALPALLMGMAVLPLAWPLFGWARGEVQRVAWQSDGRWVLVDAAGQEHADAELMPGSFTGSRALLLHWRCRACRRKFHVALLNDNCEPDAFRRLRVRLRMTSDRELYPARNQREPEPGQ